MQKAGFAQKYPIKTPFLCKTPVFCAESLIFVQNQVLHKNDFFPIKKPRLEDLANQTTCRNFYSL
jgi:hypothetical protein